MTDPKWTCHIVDPEQDAKTPDFDADVLGLTQYADAYRSTSGSKYEPPDRRGFTTLVVLPELTGRPWDQYALNIAHSLRPSSIRVLGLHDAPTGDMQPWRVTVYLDHHDDRTIKHIHQEVEVGCEGAKHGHGLWKYRCGQDPTPATGFMNTKGIKKLALDGPESP